MTILFDKSSVDVLEMAIKRLKVKTTVSGNKVKLDNRGVEITIPLTRVSNIRQGYTR